MIDTKFDGLDIAGFVEDLNDSQSRLHKEDIIASALMASSKCNTSQAFLFTCRLAYDPFLVFGVKKIPTTKDIFGAPNPWSEFWRLCTLLSARLITGNAARDEIDAMSQQFDSNQWNTICRGVLRKDLKCGVNVKTLNKILGESEWKIPVFQAQLAQPKDEYPKKMTGMKFLEKKLDGVRALALVEFSKVEIKTRNGKDLANFPHVATEIAKIQSEIGQLINGPGFILDGEMMSENFQHLMKQVRRKNNVKTGDMVFNIFDIISLDEFHAGKGTLTQTERCEILKKIGDIIKAHGITCLRVAEGILVDISTPEGNETMAEYYRTTVDEGYEGIMIKDVDAKYECSRNTAWLKWKPKITVDLKITACVLGDADGKNAMRLGAFVAEGTEDGKNIVSNVGSGFSEEMRDEFWLNRDQLIGSVIEVEADAITQNQDGTYSLRFPSFVRFRSFDDDEEKV
jgi:DNA ligase 1